MEFTSWLAPVVAGVGTAGLTVAAVSIARRDARLATPATGTLKALLALGLIVTLLLLSRDGVLTSVPSIELLLHALGFALLITAAARCIHAARLRTRADFLLSSAPLQVDEAVAKSCGKALRGVFTGRVVGAEPVTSPGGIVCAAYSAELREVGSGGARGALVSTERSTPSLIPLKGERHSVYVAFSPRQWRAPKEIRRCGTLLRPGAIAASGEAISGGEGDEGVEALSWERLVKMGETLLVVGTLTQVQKEGPALIRGLASGGAAFVVAGSDARSAGEVLRREALRAYAIALGCSALAAFFISR